MYVNMVTRPVYKNKEVCTPLNKIKHISPLQKNVFLPLTCKIFLKKNHIFYHIFSTISPPFCHDWQRVQEARKLHPKEIKMIKDDQGGTRNSYKCMNVMKQDALNNKIIERCNTCEKKNLLTRKKCYARRSQNTHTHTHTHTTSLPNFIFQKHVKTV